MKSVSCKEMKNHVTVFKDEATEALVVAKDSTIVDATLGAGGHSNNILGQLGKSGVLVGIDADKDAIDAVSLDTTAASVHLRVGNFRDINSILSELNIEAVDGVMADLGWRIEQMGGNEKGFSFRVDEPLIMTYGDPEKYPFVARDIINDWTENDIKNVLKGYGEERFSGRIARAIVENRSIEPIETSEALCEVIRGAVPGFYRKGKIHPATRTFQALRITVNDELDAIKDFIFKSVELLAPSGRLVIITFHSLEDRVVKHAFRQLKDDGYGFLPVKKPILPSREEIVRNPRSRSAKMRIFEKNEKKK